MTSSAGTAAAGQWQLFWANGSLLGIPPSARSQVSPAPAKAESAVTDPRQPYPVTSIVPPLPQVPGPSVASIVHLPPPRN